MRTARAANLGSYRPVSGSLQPISEAAAWDAFVAGNVHGHHEQSSAYGEGRAAYGIECERVVVHEAGEIAGGAQVLVRSTPVGRFGHVQRGPLASSDDPRILREVVAALDDLARRRSLGSLRVDTFAGQTAAHVALEHAGFQPSAVWHNVRDSLAVSLDRPEKQLLAGMKRKTRYSVRAALRAGVEVRVGEAEHIGDFHMLHRKTASFKSFPLFPREYFEYLWEVFGRVGRMQHFVAYHEQKPVAAIFNAIVGGRMVYGWGGIDRGEAERKLLANYPLHLAAMGWAHEHGCTHYDLSGDTPFKRKFTEDRVHWPAPHRKFYGPARALRRAMMEGVWSNKVTRKGAVKAARRLGWRPKMPH